MMATLSRQPTTSSNAVTDYSCMVNMANAKMAAVALVVSLAAYHGLLHAIHGITPCKGLFQDGAYEGDFWQPWGCMMHKYTKEDCEKCFRIHRRPNHFVFIGDSRVRQLFFATKRLLEDGSDPMFMEEGINPHADQHWELPQHNLKLDFMWLPKPNATVLSSIATQLRQVPPSTVFLSFGLHHIKEANGTEEKAAALDDFTGILMDARRDLDHLAATTTVIWMMQPTVLAGKLKPHHKTITASAIHMFNAASGHIFAGTKVSIWNSAENLVDDTAMEDMKDGLHLPVRAQVQSRLMLLNLHCNDITSFDDGTCCKGSDTPTILQIIAFAFFFLCAFLCFLDTVYISFCTSHYSSINGCKSWKQGLERYLYFLITNTYMSKDTNGNGIIIIGRSFLSENIRTFLWSFTKFGAIIVYFYVCDRTNFFMKENKSYTTLNFCLPVLIVFTLGIFFNKEAKESRLLNREQTDEWKGWMQLVILIYHMTGASKCLPTYMLVRVLVSAYIFLNGYGHFFYVWHKGEPNLRRFLQVLFRMNFVTVALCLAMNQNYQAYYFIPLITFWFSLQYFTMALPPRVTAKSTKENPIHYLYLILKMVALVTVVSMLYSSEVFFEKVFFMRPWKGLFITADGDVREWRFRWQLDRFSMIAGFCFAIMCTVAHRFRLYNDRHLGWLWSRSACFVAGAASIAGIIAYAVFAWKCMSKPDCNEFHPYISFIPIASFVVLRNIYGPLRSRFSTFFAWFGRISLELLIGQYHIWLAANSHGILVLVPSHPVVNVLLVSFVFVCCAHEIRVLTADLAPHFVPSGHSGNSGKCRTGKSAVIAL